MKNLKVTRLLIGLLIAFQYGSVWAKGVTFPKVKGLLETYGAQGMARLNPRALDDDGEGTCQIAFKFSSDGKRVLINYDFRVGFFKSISNTEEFAVTGFNPSSAYGDASLEALSQRGSKLWLSYFQPSVYSTVYRNGGYHLSIQTSEKRSYNCYDTNLTSNQMQ